MTCPFQKRPVQSSRGYRGSSTPRVKLGIKGEAGRAFRPLPNPHPFQSNRTNGVLVVHHRGFEGWGFRGARSSHLAPPLHPSKSVWPTTGYRRGRTCDTPSGKHFTAILPCTSHSGYCDTRALGEEIATMVKRRLYSSSVAGTARVWDLNDPAAAPRVLRGHEGRINAAALAADGRRSRPAGTTPPRATGTSRRPRLRPMRCRRTRRRWPHWRAARPAAS